MSKNNKYLHELLTIYDRKEIILKETGILMSKVDRYHKSVENLNNYQNLVKEELDSINKYHLDYINFLESEIRIKSKDYYKSKKKVRDLFVIKQINIERTRLRKNKFETYSHPVKNQSQVEMILSDNNNLGYKITSKRNIKIGKTKEEYIELLKKELNLCLTDPDHRPQYSCLFNIKKKL